MFSAESLTSPGPTHSGALQLGYGRIVGLPLLDSKREGEILSPYLMPLKVLQENGAREGWSCPRSQVNPSDEPPSEGLLLPSGKEFEW